MIDNEYVVVDIDANNIGVQFSGKFSCTEVIGHIVDPNNAVGSKRCSELY